ncbi:tripartite tricarboxylate transporter TctB family protein [Rhodophyticola sp. CCM32]|uniref:tripartite tricarboxylate transporter TctB family protein n=1 Tax=Rhodophyticola sp. CCM32 TaxID=2916397 RepID=UPI00107F488D|nr:tripartite tricarboxylate transporter TctB family protein [Rhodophyticola sp. CCM32]QBY01316.1 tripartite tricarboxylate transporter TctB family protein [Rhodophyticola sp. CCM32]
MSAALVRTIMPGLCVSLFGAFVAAIALTYPLGSALRPGPGFFPLAIGGTLVVLGLLVIIEAWRARPLDEDNTTGIAWRGMLATCAAILVFALLLERLGYVPAAIALVLIVGMGEPGRNWRVLGVIAIFMALFGTVVFIWGFGLPIEPFEGL